MKHETQHQRERRVAIWCAGGRCEACGSNHRLTAHHVVPRREGGADRRSNYRILCRPCHDEWHNVEKTLGAAGWRRFEGWLNTKKQAKPMAEPVVARPSRISFRPDWPTVVAYVATLIAVVMIAKF